MGSGRGLLYVLQSFNFIFKGVVTLKESIKSVLMNSGVLSIDKKDTLENNTQF